MPTRLLDHLERYLKHARFDGPVPIDEPPPVECPRCHDQGYLRRDVTAVADDFGRLVECPCGIVQTRRMRRIWASSQIPTTMRGYSLASFVLHAGKQQLVDDVRESWAAGDRWLLLCGPVGLGKTGIAVSLLLEAMHAGSGGLYVVMPSFLSRIRATYTRGKDDEEVDETDVLASVIEAPLLVLDDLGKVTLTEWGQEKLFTVVNERYLAGRRTIVTSNLDPEDGSLEAHLWPATWDRLRGMSDVFRLTGDSLR